MANWRIGWTVSRAEGRSRPPSACLRLDLGRHGCHDQDAWCTSDALRVILQREDDGKEVAPSAKHAEAVARPCISTMCVLYPRRARRGRHEGCFPSCAHRGQWAVGCTDLGGCSGLSMMVPWKPLGGCQGEAGGRARRRPMSIEELRLLRLMGLEHGRMIRARALACCSTLPNKTHLDCTQRRVRTPDTAFGLHSGTIWKPCSSRIAANPVRTPSC